MKRNRNSCSNIARHIFRFVNQERRKKGPYQLTGNRGLIILASIHSSKMARRGRIWHGDGVHRAGGFIYKGWGKDLWRKYGLFSIIIAPLLFIVNSIFTRGISGENVAMMPRGRVKGHKRPLRSDKDIARALHRAWMRSPGHRKNMMNTSFTKLGVGVKRKGNKFYATQLFYG